LKTLRYLVLDLGLPAEYRNKDSITPLHNSTFNGHRACSEFLLSEIGVTPNVCNRSKLTPIRNSCANGHLMVTRLLASYGADYTMLDHTGANALSHASDKTKAKAAIALGFVDHVFNKRRFALMMWMSWNDSPWKVDNLAMSSSS
jgi:ankyrin repeat protein